MKHVNHILLLASIFVVVALGLAAAVVQSAAAEPPSPAYTSIIYPCRYDVTNAVAFYPTDKELKRNVLLYNYGETNGLDPNYRVETIETLSWNFNFAKGKGVVWGPIEQNYYSPSAGPGDDPVGTWVGTIVGRTYWDPEFEVPLAEGNGFFVGLGDFAGLRMKSAWRQEHNPDGVEVVCAGQLPDPDNENELAAWPVKTLIIHYVIETTGTWPPPSE